MTRVVARFAVLALALVVSIGAFAKPKSDNITLYHDATINGVNLPAGDYVVKYDVQGNTAQVTFIKGRKEVATATGQVKNLSRKADNSQVVVDTQNNVRAISEIDFGGKDTAISFESSATAVGK